MDRARDFYENVLKQKVKFDFGENVTFWGDFSIHLASHYSHLIDQKPIKHGGNNFELYFEEDQIEQVVATLKKHQIQFIHEIREQPWRQKVVRFYDPDHHIIEIGESLEYLSYRLNNEGLTPDQISKTTNMPMDFVKVSIKQYRG